MELEIINKLYLELSQIATAKTKQELELESLLEQVLVSWRCEANQGDGILDTHIPVYNRAMKKINHNFEPDFGKIR